jgi:AcrR family transcriptional regulator
MAKRKGDSASPRWERRRTRARAALRDAARAVLERKGYVQTTLRDIMDESDITHPTFYKYFASKEDVLADLIDGLIDELVATGAAFGFAQAKRGSGAEPSVRGRVRLGMRAVLEVARKNRQLLIVVRQAIHANELHERRWQRLRSRAIEVVERDLAWARAAGLVRCDDLGVIAIAMVATIEAALFDLAAREEHEPAVVESILESFYWNALFGWRGGPVDYVIVPGKDPRPVYSTEKVPARSTRRAVARGGRRER